MAIFNFFKTPKVRQYHHEFIYYDPKKEEREERLKRVREEIECEKEGKQQHILRKGVFQEQRTTNKASAQSRNIRLTILIVVVVALLMWYMK
jgi:hypothetical protein